MAKNLNMKVKFTADTKNLADGSKEAKAAISDFEKSSTGAIDNFASLFGTSMGEISSQFNVFKGGLLLISKGLKDAGKETNSFSRQLKILKVALASTGIGVLVVALGSLVAYFTKTERGADKLTKILAPFKQLFLIISDAAAAVGEAIVGAFENPVETIENFGKAIVKNIVNRVLAVFEGIKAVGKMIKSLFDGEFAQVAEGAKDFGRAWIQGMTGFDREQQDAFVEKTKNAFLTVEEKMRRRNELAQRQIDFQNQEIENETKLADLLAKKEQARNRAADKEKYSAAERKKANEEAIDYANQYYDLLKAQEEERLAILVEENSLSNSLKKDRREEEALKKSIIEIEAQRASQTKEMVSMNATLNAELAVQVKLEREAAAARAASLQMREKYNSMRIENVDSSQILESAPATSSVKLDIPEEEVQAFRDKMNALHAETGTLMDFGPVIRDGLGSALEEVGTLFGNLITGNGGLKEFANNLVSIFADMASKVGKMLIQFGLSAIALEKLMDNPELAIAAGAALVALAAAAKSAVSDVVSGGGAMSGAPALSAGGSLTVPRGYSGEAETAPVKVEVSGTLSAKGENLIAVINNTNNKKRLTT